MPQPVNEYKPLRLMQSRPRQLPFSAFLYHLAMCRKQLLRPWVKKAPREGGILLRSLVPSVPLTNRDDSP
jgi:hypothetical protein